MDSSSVHSDKGVPIMMIVMVIILIILFNLALYTDRNGKGVEKIIMDKIEPV